MAVGLVWTDMTPTVSVIMCSVQCSPTFRLWNIHSVLIVNAWKHVLYSTKSLFVRLLYSVQCKQCTVYSVNVSGACIVYCLLYMHIMYNVYTQVLCKETLSLPWDTQYTHTTTLTRTFVDASVGADQNTQTRVIRHPSPQQFLIYNTDATFVIVYFYSYKMCVMIGPFNVLAYTFPLTI